MSPTGPESNKTVLTRTSSNLLDLRPTGDLRRYPPELKTASVKLHGILCMFNCI